MVYSNLQEIATCIGFGEKRHDVNKIKSLLDNNFIKSIINDAGVRARYYSTDSMINYSLSLLEKYFSNNKIQYNSIKDIIEKTYQFLDNMKLNSTSKKKCCEVITMTILKGGVGKTTSAINVATSFALLGQKVLVVDTDPQANSSHYFNDDDYSGKSLSTLIEKYYFNNGKLKDTKVEDFIHTIKTDFFSIDLLPSELKLGRNLEATRNMLESHLMLNDFIKTIKQKYDYIIIDTPPSSMMGIALACSATNSVVIPTTATKYAVDGLKLTLEEIMDMKERLGNRNDINSININSIFVTSYEQTSSQKMYLSDIQDLADDLSIPNVKVIKKSSIVETSQACNTPLPINMTDLKASLQIAEPMIDYAIEKLIEKNNRSVTEH